MAQMSYNRQSAEVLSASMSDWNPPAPRATLLLLCWCLIGATRVDAQQPIGDEVLCAQCSIRKSVTARFGDVDGPGAIPGIPSSVVVDAQGRFLVIFPSTAPMLFGSDGRFVQQVGRMGGGPGEFRDPRNAVRAGDSIAIIDFGRVSILGPDLQLTRTVSLSGLTPVEVVPVDWPSSVLISGTGLVDTDLVGWPLHILDVSKDVATVVKSFGENEGVLIPDLPQLVRRHVTIGRNAATIWAVGPYTYGLTQWSRDGRLQRHFRRDAAWGPDGSGRLRGGPEVAPGPRVAAIHEDEAERLWVITHIPSATWREAWRDMTDRARIASSAGDVAARLFPSSSALYQSMIEVIDPARPGVVTREQLNGYVTQVLPDGRWIVYRESTTGVPYLEVITASLEGAV